MDWFEADTVWDIYGIKTRAQFVQKFVVEGKFHSNVPEDIKESFITVSYLLAHSYYHSPMFDEAMSKMLLIMEMAIKLKAETLGIPIKKGKRNRRLVDIINEVFKKEEMKYLKSDFDRARDLRNIKMHPKSHHFMGPMGLVDANAKLFINTINLLFLEDNQLELIYTKTEHLQTKLSSIKKGFQVLQFRNKKIIIDGFHNFKYIQCELGEFLVLHVNPVTTTVHQQFTERKYPAPLVIVFTDILPNENSISGIDLEGEPIRITKDNNPQNLSIYNYYKEALKNISDINIDIFNIINGNNGFWQMEKIIYENCWN